MQRLVLEADRGEKAQSRLVGSTLKMATVSATLKDGRVITLAPVHEHPEFMEQISRHTFQVWPDVWADLGFPTYDSILGYFKDFKGGNVLPFYVCAFVDNELLGFCGTDTTERDGDTRSPWLVDVFVVPAYRRLGLFRIIVTYMMNWNKSNGVNQMWLWTRPHQQVLYEQVGWKFEMTENWVTEGLGPQPNPTMTVMLNEIDLPQM